MNEMLIEMPWRQWDRSLLRHFDDAVHFPSHFPYPHSTPRSQCVSSLGCCRHERHSQAFIHTSYIRTTSYGLDSIWIIRHISRESNADYSLSLLDHELKEYDIFASFPFISLLMTSFHILLLSISALPFIASLFSLLLIIEGIYQKVSIIWRFFYYCHRSHGFHRFDYLIRHHDRLSFTPAASPT